MRTPSGLRIDAPAWPLLQAHITYWDVTDANGSILGTTVVCGNLANEPSYQGLAVKVLDGNAAGQVKPIATHPAGTNTLTVADPFTDNTGAAVQIVAGTRFVILSMSGAGAPAPVLAPSIGLWMFGECDPGMAASQTVLVLTNLAGFPDDIFNNEFWIQVIHNDNAPGTAPEREIRRVTNYVGATGTFTTDAFTANVEANDLVAVFHESIMSIEILGFGTLDTSSATVPADSTRAEGDNYFNGCLLIATEGAVRFQPRRIVDYTGVGGIFTIDPNNPFTAATGLVDYIIIGDQCEFVPAADGTNNRTPSDVIGNKADTALYALAADASVMRYIKAVLQSRIIATGTFTTSSTTIPADTGRTEGNDYFKNCILMPISGSAAYQPRPIRQFTSVTDVFTLDEPFTVAPGLVDYIIIASDYPVQRLLDIFNLVNAMLVTTETGGTLTTTGAVQDVYINNAPAGVYEPLKVIIDLSNMTAAETVVIRELYRIRPAPAVMTLKDQVTFVGVQTNALKNIELEPNRYGVQVTLQCTAGGPIDVPWEVTYRV